MRPSNLLRALIRILFTEASEMALLLAGVPAAFLTSPDTATPAATQSGMQQQKDPHPERVEENVALSHDERLWLSELDLEGS